MYKVWIQKERGGVGDKGGGEIFFTLMRKLRMLKQK